MSGLATTRIWLRVLGYVESLPYKNFRDEFRASRYGINCDDAGDAS